MEPQSTTITCCFLILGYFPSAVVAVLPPFPPHRTSVLSLVCSRQTLHTPLRTLRSPLSSFLLWRYGLCATYVYVHCGTLLPSLLTLTSGRKLRPSFSPSRRGSQWEWRRDLERQPIGIPTPLSFSTCATFSRLYRQLLLFNDSFFHRN